MVDYIEHIINIMIEVMGSLGPLAGFVFIMLESILPILPLAAFIALNMLVFGHIYGFIISWIATIFGCLLSFYFFRRGLSDKLYKKIKIDGKTRAFMNYISDIDFKHLVLIVALPFTPAFAVNIASGLSKMSVRKFLAALLIGKISIIYFWGYVGTSLIESLRDPEILIQLVIMMSIVYVVSMLIQKKIR